MSATVRGGAVAALAVLLWQAMVSLLALPPYILPGPLSVATTLWESRILIAHHAAVTLLEIGAGLGLGVGLGMATAILMAWSALARATMRPMLVFSQAIPVFALAPILTLWLGYGFWPKVVMALLIIFFPVTSAFFDGLTNTRRDWLDIAHAMGARRSHVMVRIQVPAAVPALASGIRMAAVYAPIGAVIGEWVGASQGLGYLMLMANGRAKIDLMFAALLVLAATTIFLRAMVDLFCTRVLQRYMY